MSLPLSAMPPPVWRCPLNGLAIVMAVVVALGGCTSNSTSTGPTPGTGQTSTAAGHTFTVAPPPQTTQTTVAPPPPVGMNQEARDGTFGFTVFNVWTDKQVGTPP
jgi:hypothetical protein